MTEGAKSKEFPGPFFSPTLPEALKDSCQEVLAQSLKARRGNNEERSFHLAFGRKSLDRLQWSACNIVPN